MLHSHITSHSAIQVAATKLPILLYEIEKESGVTSPDTTLVSVTNIITQNATKIILKSPLTIIGETS